MDENQLAAKVLEIETEGKSRHGDAWGKYVDAIARANSNNPQLGAAMKEVLGQPDPCAIIAAGGREALINLADQGDEAADRTYAKIREAERQEYRTLRGRR
jgi:hypothetical protein